MGVNSTRLLFSQVDTKFVLQQRDDDRRDDRDKDDQRWTIDRKLHLCVRTCEGVPTHAHSEQRGVRCPVFSFSDPGCPNCEKRAVAGRFEEELSRRFVENGTGFHACFFRERANVRVCFVFVFFSLLFHTLQCVPNTTETKFYVRGVQ